MGVARRGLRLEHGERYRAGGESNAAAVCGLNIFGWRQGLQPTGWVTTQGGQQADGKWLATVRHRFPSMAYRRCSSRALRRAGDAAQPAMLARTDRMAG
jgi:hypothetical protein